MLVNDGVLFVLSYAGVAIATGFPAFVSPIIFVLMAIQRMPKTIRWIGICALLLLAVLSLYRIGIYQLFPDVFSGAKKNAAQAFWFGFRFDVRLVAAISLFMIAISFWPGLHFFKWEGGKKIALFLYGFFCYAYPAFLLI